MNSFQPNRKIRVVWFAASFVSRSASGTAQTARKIIINLIKNHSDKIEVILLTKNQLEIDLIRKEEVFKDTEIVKLPNVFGSWLKSSRQFYKFCLLNRGTKFDILHYSVPRVYPFFWFFPAKKIVCTFHAGGDVTAPKDYFVLSREIYNKIIKVQWRKFDSIIAVSQFAAKEISLAYKIPLNFITVIYGGADNLWGQISHSQAKDPCLVIVIGRWQSYKNLHSIINAFKNLELPNNPHLRLKLIGKKNYQNKVLVNALNNFPPSQIEIVEYLSDYDLALEYRKASVVFHPSINEGFGLPTFEAFGEGARVIAHFNTPSAEILGGQPGVLFGDMLNEQQIIEKYHLILRQDFGIIETRRDFLREIGVPGCKLPQNIRIFMSHS